MTHSQMWHDAFAYMQHDSFTYVTWRIVIGNRRGDSIEGRTCDMTHSYAWHDSFVCATGLIHVCDMTHAHMCPDSYACMTRLIHTGNRFGDDIEVENLTLLMHTHDMTHLFFHICDMMYSHMWYDAFTYVPRLIHMCGTTHSHRQPPWRRHRGN